MSEKSSDEIPRPTRRRFLQLAGAAAAATWLEARLPKTAQAQSVDNEEEAFYEAPYFYYNNPNLFKPDEFQALWHQLQPFDNAYLGKATASDVLRLPGIDIGGIKENG